MNFKRADNHVFFRQIEVLFIATDVVAGISTSGKSRNVLMAREFARRSGASIGALTVKGRCILLGCDHVVLDLVKKGSRHIQEVSIFCRHMLWDWVERSVCRTAATEQEAASR
jgi:D-sedoheptulose 7-phosphate isomerase